MKIDVCLPYRLRDNLLQMEQDMKSIAVILSGCGVFDGSEVHESVLTMLALSQNNAEVHFLHLMNYNRLL